MSLIYNITLLLSIHGLWSDGRKSGGWGKLSTLHQSPLLLPLLTLSLFRPNWWPRMAFRSFRERLFCPDFVNEEDGSRKSRGEATFQLKLKMDIQYALSLGLSSPQIPYLKCSPSVSELDMVKGTGPQK